MKLRSSLILGDIFHKDVSFLNDLVQSLVFRVSETQPEERKKEQEESRYLYSRVGPSSGAASLESLIQVEMRKRTRLETVLSCGSLRSARHCLLEQ